MRTIPHVALVGLPAVGKSSIGRRLAKAIDRPFLDADELAERECGLTITELFSTVGEPAFRDLEHRLLERALMAQAPRVVLATGGGVVLDSRNRRLLCEHAFTVHLDGSAETLVTRLRRSRRRPLFDGVEIDEKLRLLREQRSAHYAEVSRLKVEIERQPMRDVVGIIVARLREYEAETS